LRLLRSAVGCTACTEDCAALWEGREGGRREHGGQDEEGQTPPAKGEGRSGHAVELLEIYS